MYFVSKNSHAVTPRYSSVFWNFLLARISSYIFVKITSISFVFEYTLLGQIAGSLRVL